MELGGHHHSRPDAGQPGHARTTWTTALDILTDLDHPDAEDVRAKLATLDRPSLTQPATSPPPA